MHHISRARIHIEAWSIKKIPMGVFTFMKGVNYTHTLFQFLLSLSYTSITWLNHYRTQKPILSWFETRRKTQATFFRCNIPRVPCQWETRVTQLQYQYLWQEVMNVSTRKFSTLVDSWLGNHITFPVVLNTDIISKYSSSKALNIWPVIVQCISASLFQHLMMCLACTLYLIHTDDVLHLHQKCSLVLMICLTCTAYPCSHCTYSI